ncbi:hypothetical protein [Kiloniella sp.]|uniref:hypothetical protein n=1 Tax=Kiloniella sp. TaxID=1938587 RepID=UPI003A913F21
MSFYDCVLNVFSSRDFNNTLSKLKEENDINTENLKIYKHKLGNRFLLIFLLIFLVWGMCIYSYLASGKLIPIYAGIFISILFLFSLFYAPMKRLERMVISCTTPTFVMGTIIRRWIDRYGQFEVRYEFFLNGTKHTDVQRIGVGYYFSEWEKNKPVEIVCAKDLPKYSCIYIDSNFNLYCLSNVALTLEFKVES